MKWKINYLLRKVGHWGDQARWKWYFHAGEDNIEEPDKKDWYRTNGGGWVFCDASGMTGVKERCGGLVWDGYCGRWKKDR